MLIDEYDIELSDVDCVPGSIYSAKAQIPNDVSEVMPYLNAILSRVQYGADNSFLVWKDSERKYALRPHELAISQIIDRPQAVELARKTVSMINDVWERREEITPDFEPRMPPAPLEIFKRLPKTNCGDCGVKSCLAFATELSEGNLEIEDCPYLLTEENACALEALKDLSL